MRFGIGQPVTRKEDPRFLTGRGRYVADIDLPARPTRSFLFSSHAHARIVDRHRRGSKAPGVYAVLTGQDWAADGLGTLDPEDDAGGHGRPQGPSYETAAAGDRAGCAMSASGSRWSSPQRRISRATRPSWSRSNMKSCPRWSRPGTRCGRARRSSTTTCPATSRSRCAWAMPKRWNPLLRGQRTSPGCRWEQPDHRGYDGAARLYRRIRSGHPPLHPLHQHPACARRTPHPRASDIARAGKPHPRRRARCRRRLRHEGQPPSRGGGRNMGGAAGRAAGEVDPVAHGSAARRQ